jgi:hypothetical protein
MKLLPNHAHIMQMGHSFRASFPVPQAVSAFSYPRGSLAYRPDFMGFMAGEVALVRNIRVIRFYPVGLHFFRSLHLSYEG